ncbi:hypothetical protein RRG08_045488 [Elysia crispata]|uniref:Uncharacterized protein n=1 Tax=Elysia crispata TaxID=231223 RepID=A0AAE1AG70_9GAST|nr:hypothetical protein RRG08_045488 [Elysia crispata]
MKCMSVFGNVLIDEVHWPEYWRSDLILHGTVSPRPPRFTIKFKGQGGIGRIFSISSHRSPNIQADVWCEGTINIELLPAAQGR